MAQVSHIELHPPRWISLELSGDNYNIGSDNGPVPIGNKPLHRKMLNNSTSPEHNELIALLGKVVLYYPFKQSGEPQCNALLVSWQRGGQVICGEVGKEVLM